MFGQLPEACSHFRFLGQGTLSHRKIFNRDKLSTEKARNVQTTGFGRKEFDNLVMSSKKAISERRDFQTPCRSASKSTAASPNSCGG